MNMLRNVSCMIKKVILYIQIIIQCIDKQQYIHVQQTESTKDMWDTLNQQYNKVSLYQQKV